MAGVTPSLLANAPRGAAATRGGAQHAKKISCCKTRGYRGCALRACGGNNVIVDGCRRRACAYNARGQLRENAASLMRIVISGIWTRRGDQR